jgi:hypothetical protein
MSATCLHSTAVMSLPKSRYGPKDRSVLGAEANVQARTDESERQWEDRGNAAAASFLRAFRRFSFCLFFRHTCVSQFTTLSASRPILKVIVEKLMNEKLYRFSKEVSCSRFKSAIYLEGLRKFPDRVTRGSRCPVRDMNRVTTTPTC